VAPGAQQNRAWSRLNRVPSGERDHLTRDLDLSFRTVDSRGNMVAKTLEAALVAAQTYMLATQPAAGDPRAALHLSNLAGLHIIGASLKD
jgi:hypothetical protein